MAKFQLTFEGSPDRAMATIKSAIARREETRMNCMRKLKRTKLADRASWAMSIAECEMDISAMHAMMQALGTAKEVQS